jgi:hypothetical protein
MQRRHHPVTLQQAAQESPTLASLSMRLAQSQACLKAVQSALPSTLRASVQAGPLEAREWCLLVRSSAAAAKVRQLLPDCLALLKRQGLPVDTLRIKVSSGR